MRSEKWIRIISHTCDVAVIGLIFRPVNVMFIILSLLQPPKCVKFDVPGFQSVLMRRII